MKLTFTVELEIDTAEPGMFPEVFAEYLTEPSNPFLTDYGPDAWGGYEGPKVVGTPVVKLAGMSAGNRIVYPAAVCDTCGDESNSEPGLPCGRDLRDELGAVLMDKDDEAPVYLLPDGTLTTAVFCTGTYLSPKS